MAFFAFKIKDPIFFMQVRSSSSASKTKPVPSSKSTAFTVDYLVNSCGLTSESAVVTSRNLCLSKNNIQRHDSVLHVLRAHGFDTTHFPKLVQKFPNLLNLNADENLKPKLEFLVENGFSGSHLHDLIVSNPVILGRSLSVHVKPSFRFLKSFLGSEERLRLAVKRSPRLLSNDLKGTLQPNIELFVKEGVPVDAIAQFFVVHTRKMQASAERMMVGLETFKDEFGISVDPVASPKSFLNGVCTLASMEVQAWKRRVELLKSLLGCSQEVVISIFRLYPSCFPLSEETLRSKVKFYFKAVRLKPEVIIKYPALLGYSIDKRIRPRYNVLKVLVSKKLLKKNLQLARLFRLGEEKFLDKYVTQHLQQLPSLLEMYTNDNIGI